MGDILGAAFGGGKNTDQKTTPDANARALNKLKLAQFRKLFAGSDMGEFARPNTEDFTLSRRTNDIINSATGPENMMSLQDYLDQGLDEGKGFINKVATPEIMAQLGLQGMSRSGAAPEAIAKATAGIAMPFLSSIPGFMSASTQQATGLAGLSDMPRALRAEDFMRRQGILQTGMTGLPFAPGSKTIGNENSLPMFHMFGTG